MSFRILGVNFQDIFEMIKTKIYGTYHAFLQTQRTIQTSIHLNDKEDVKHPLYQIKLRVGLHSPLSEWFS